MILTRRAILARIESGHIVAPPELVQENSVNVRLGSDMWTCKNDSDHVDLHKPRDFTLVRPSTRYYGEYSDIPVLGFWLKPGRVYIGTTVDAHGTRLLGDGLAFVPEMRARSTTGRHGLTVALCAGVGDVGYAGRWALEIINNNRADVFIAVGTEIGQVVYHTASETYPVDGYGGADRYQKADGSIQFLPRPFEVPERCLKPK